MVDTNNSPEGIDYIIPGNDDSSRAIRLYARGVADAILEGKNNIAKEVASGDDLSKSKRANNDRQQRAPALLSGLTISANVVSNVECQNRS